MYLGNSNSKFRLWWAMVGFIFIAKPMGENQFIVYRVNTTGVTICTSAITEICATFTTRVQIYYHLV